MLEPRPLDDLPSARDATRVAGLWARAHPLGPCAGDPAPAAADAWGVEVDGELVALGAIRTWGRVGHVHGLAVADPMRRRGIGVALLQTLVAELERRDAAVIGMEVDASGAGALTTLARAGFKPMQLSFILEGPTMPVEGAALTLLAGAAGAEGLAPVRGLSASVDSELDPTAWLSERLARGEVEVALVGEPQAPGALAVLPSAAGGDALAVSVLLCAEGPPRHVLPGVMGALGRLAAERGLTKLQVAAPSRYWDATRALLDMGFRPRASFLRLTRLGHPERADLGRTCLATWR